MNASDWRQALDELKKDLVSVEARANNVSKELPGLCRSMESLKLDILESKLERERRRVARVRGFTAIGKDKKKLGIGLGAALAGMFVMAALHDDHDEAPNRDNVAALGSGIRVLDSCLQGFGSADWAVSMDEAMLVVPADQTVSGRLWVSWQDLVAAIRNLRTKAMAGQHLGGMDAIIFELKKGCQVPTYHMKKQTVTLIRRGDC